ncbi:unnamed protein product [Aureobasidium vineae]|uniref:Uncharacterized protein n=1 Tax=Aureobasidium vineae TaxID=2773715 RepID=A0A9N8PAX6_9PEZI|nr:unnamed protein product [Aureobasidium vineae]
MSSRHVSLKANLSRSYFVVGNLAESQEELIRICSLLRGTESAVQAVSVSPQSSRLYWPKQNSILTA